MTTTMNRGIPDRVGPAVPAPLAAPLGRLPRRRRWGFVALGIILVAVCAVVAYLLVTTAGVTRPYLAVTRNLPQGAAITSADLTVVDVNPAAGLHLVAADERDKVIGKHVAADLFAGTLLNPAQLTDLAVPGPGQQLVGVELKPAQVPARTLKPGDAVILVVVPPTGLSGVPESPANAAARPQSITATVAGAMAPATNGNVRVDVAVTQADGPTVASMAAAGRVVVVLAAGR